MTEDNIAIRLKLLITDLGINSSVFADTCGISRATLSQLLTGRNKKINDILISQIHKAYPNLSIMWLLFNEGDMWSKSSHQDNTSDSSEPNGPTEEISIDESNSTDNPYSNRKQDTGYSKNPSDNQNSLTTGRDDMQYSKENGLNQLENITNETINQEINARIKTASLMNEIEILRSKIKKVVQITIYYDDSTFESFYPK